MVFGASAYDVPLLPYERQLIATIGITEEEYRAFTAEVKKRGAVRPAAYDHIPDVQATGLEPGTLILINLAISLVLTGVSYLLTPKPKMPGAQKRGGQTDLGSIVGANRFTPSRGFETLAELADYASPVPLIFGLYKDDIGGMLVTPKLIWSRMFSHGTMQRAKLMFVVGEQGVGSEGIQAPELKGIFLGNNPLDALFKDSFAFYWHADSSSNFRIRGNDKIYGTRGKAHRGDPDVSNDDGDAFTFPLSGYGVQPSKIFCHAYTPSNSTQFGVYGAIANGTQYRVNYQLISIPHVDDKEAMAIRTLERIKVVGDSGITIGGETLYTENLAPGQASDERLNDIRNPSTGGHDGAGRNYSPRMGIIEAKGQTTGSDARKLVVSNVEVGDRATFLISNTVIDDNFLRRKNGKGSSVDDINSTVESLQIEADTSMQVGEHFEIGGCIWKVVKRNISIFDPLNDDHQEIVLECVDISTSITKRIGVVSKDLVVQPTGARGFIGDGGVGETSINVGEGFYPLTQVEVATIKNNRPAVSTEIGLKSTVFQRLNGLCNFQSLPTPSELRDQEKDGIQVNSGTISATIMRSSMFRVFIREVESSDETFTPISRIFVVRGQKPVAQYNYMRFTTSTAVELEYKFVPVSGSELRLVSDTAQFVELSSLISTNQNENGSAGFFEFEQSIANLGDIRVQVTGRPVNNKDAFKANKEFTRGGRTVLGSTEQSYPASAVFLRPTPEVNVGTTATKNSKLVKGPNIANSGINIGKLSAFFYAIVGSADDSTTSLNGFEEFESVEYIGGNTANWLHLKWRVKKTTNTLTYASSEATKWAFNRVTVLGSGGGFSRRQKIEVKRGSEATNVTTGQSAYPSSNPFVSGHTDGTLEFSGMILTIRNVTEDQELPARSQAWRYEVLGAVDRAVGESKTQTLTITEGSKTIRVDLTSQVREFVEPIVGQDKGWTIPKVTKIYQTSDTSQTWNIGEEFTSFRSVSASNPFKTEYTRVGQTYGITELNFVTEPSTVEADLFFATQSQYVDISSYRGLVEKSNSRGPEHEIVYVNEAQINDSPAKMLDLTITGLSLKASRNFTALDQMRCWLGSGIPVERLHPFPANAYDSSNTTGPSNLFTDLVYFLLTDQRAGAGGLLGMDKSIKRNYLVDKNDLVKTSRFLEKQKLFF